jgi:hypothetical protein
MLVITVAGPQDHRGRARKASCRMGERSNLELLLGWPVGSLVTPRGAESFVTPGLDTLCDG